MKKQPKINEMVALIEAIQPKTINDIRNENPGFSDILKSGVSLGDSDQADELKVRARVCSAGLESILKVCSEELVKLKSKLKFSQKIQFAGQILSAIGSASVIISLAKSIKMEYTLISGVIGLVGSIIPLVVDFKNKGLDKNKKLDEIYTDLNQMQIEAKANLNELTFYTVNGFNEDGIREVINKSNQLAAKISILLSLT